MDLEKLIAEGKAKVNCQKHDWQKILNAITQCNKCLKLGVCFSETPNDIFLLNELIDVSRSHNWAVAGNGFTKCVICDIKGTMTNNLSKYYSQISVSYIQEILNVRYLPAEPITCGNYIMREVMT